MSLVLELLKVKCGNGRHPLTSQLTGHICDSIVFHEQLRYAFFFHLNFINIGLFRQRPRFQKPSCLNFRFHTLILNYTISFLIYLVVGVVF